MSALHPSSTRAPRPVVVILMIVALIVVAAMLTAAACGGGTTPTPSGSTGAATPPGAGGWKSVDMGSKIRGVRLDTVSFADATHGLAIGWLPQPTAEAAAQAVSTSDGGATWTQTTLGATSQGAAFNAVSSPEAGKVWGVGDLGFIATSTDNGATWLYQTQMAEGQDLVSVSFVDARNGWAVGSQLQPTFKPAIYTPVVLHTSDGGITWKQQSPQHPGPAGNAHVPAMKLTAVRFTDAQNGWAAGAEAANATTDPQGNGRGIVFHTTDGGAIWSAHEMSAGTGPLFAVAATDASHCWAVGAGGVVVSTADGGATWSEGTTGQQPASAYLSAVTFTDSLHGWAGGKDLLLGTSDGGKTWTKRMSGTFDVLALCCTSDGSAWASGDTRTAGGPVLPALWHYAAQ